MTETRKCIYCGRSLETDMFFCPRCGRPVPTDRIEETKVFSIFEERNIPSVPVMRTAHLVDTGMFPVIQDEDYPEEKKEEEKPLSFMNDPEGKEETKPLPVEAEPEEKEDTKPLPVVTEPEEKEDTKPLPAVKELDESEDTRQIPPVDDDDDIQLPSFAEVKALPEDEKLMKDFDFSAYLNSGSAEEADQEDDLDLSFMESLSMFSPQKAEPELEKKALEIAFPELPEEKEETKPLAAVIEPEPEPELEVTEEKEPELASFANSSYEESEEEESTGEIDVLGDLQSVLKTLLADEGTDPEEDKLTGASRDSRPSDSTYDVPFVLRLNPVSDEDTKAALQLAGLDEAGREDTKRTDTVTPSRLRDRQQTVVYENLFKEKEEKKLADEGQTVVFQPVEQDLTPMRHAKKTPAEPAPEEVKPEPQPEPVPEKKAKKEKKEKKKEKLTPPPEEPEDEKKKSQLPMILLIVLLLAMIAGLVYFLFFRGTDEPVTPSPVKTAVPAETAEPTAETTPEPTPESTPETTPEPTPEATPTPTPEPASKVVGKVLVKVEGLNIRSTAGTTGQILGQAKNGTEYEVYAEPVTANGYTWYKISENEEKWIADNGNWLTYTKN